MRDRALTHLRKVHCKNDPDGKTFKTEKKHIKDCIFDQNYKQRKEALREGYVIYVFVMLP